MISREEFESKHFQTHGIQYGSKLTSAKTTRMEMDTILSMKKMENIIY